MSRHKLLVCLSFLMAASALANRPYAVEERVAAKLRAGGQKIIVDQMPMFDGNPATITLERFEVWAPDVQIIKYDDERHETKLPRPATKFYRGRITGDPKSTVFISVEPNGVINGMALSGDDRKLAIGHGVRVGARGNRGDDREAPVLVREIDDFDDQIDNVPDFHCDVEGKAQAISHRLSALKPIPEGNSAPSVTTAYGLNLAIETDGELWAAFGSGPAVTSYLGNLIGQASVIYQRDLKTTLTIGITHLYSNAATDPWTVLPASGTSAALDELGNYWHNNFPSANRSTVVMISGKLFNGGIAWVNTLCFSDFPSGPNWGGGYAFCGSAGSVTTTVPDPTLTVNGIQYGLPSNFWMLLEVCHELGHNANGPHTHCVPITALQKVTYGVTRDWVDTCFYNEPGCVSDGGAYPPGHLGTSSDVPPEKGTIMSYCHNIFVSGVRQSRYAFGVAGQPSELVFPYFTSGFDAATPNGAISLGASEPLPCSAGQTASVTPTSSMSWQITGGAITSATNIATITYTPTGPSVVLTVTVGNTNGCSITSQRTATALCGSLPAPTGVDAHATSTSNVQISWNSVATATMYEVSRLDTLGSAYSVLGTTALLSFNDPVSVNKAYLYKVRAVAPASGSYSTPDLATVVIYANPTLTAGSSIVAAQDLVDIRNAAQAVRTLANQGVFSFTNPITAQVTAISAVHQSELRTVVNSAFTALGLTAISYTHPTPVAGATIFASDMTDLRNGMR